MFYFLVGYGFTELCWSGWFCGREEMVIAVALVWRDMWFQGDVVQQLLIFYFFFVATA